MEPIFALTWAKLILLNEQLYLSGYCCVLLLSCLLIFLHQKVFDQLLSFLMKTTYTDIAHMIEQNKKTELAHTIDVKERKRRKETDRCG